MPSSTQYSLVFRNEAECAFWMWYDGEICCEEERQVFYGHYLSLFEPVSSPSRSVTDTNVTLVVEQRKMASMAVDEDTQSTAYTSESCEDCSSSGLSDSESETESEENSLRGLGQAFLDACSEGSVAVLVLRDLVTNMLLNSASLNIQSKSDFSEVLSEVFGEHLNEDLRSQFLKSLDHCRRLRGEECFESVKKSKRGGKSRRARNHAA